MQIYANNAAIIFSKKNEKCLRFIVIFALVRR